MTRDGGLLVGPGEGKVLQDSIGVRVVVKVVTGMRTVPTQSTTTLFRRGLLAPASPPPRSRGDLLRP